MAPRRDELDQTVTTTIALDLRRRGDGTRFTLPTVRVVAGPDMLGFSSIYPEEEVTIGRDEACELTLHDASVSRRHAIIRSDAQGNLSLRDLGSTNGTSHNGTPVQGPEAVRVLIGDQVDVGGITLRVDRLGLDELAHLARVHERLSLANKDPLTGLLTRLYLDEELPGVVTRHEHANLPLSAVFLDVDHFKRVNDTWGHGVGDEVLRAVARLMALAVRDADTCVRYGGEELLALLPNCDELGAVQMAERLRTSIVNHDWSHYAEPLKVTASLGVAQHKAGEQTREWLECADKALYSAKTTGRNRTIAASTLR